MVTIYTTTFPKLMVIIYLTSPLNLSYKTHGDAIGLSSLLAPRYPCVLMLGGSSPRKIT